MRPKFASFGGSRGIVFGEIWRATWVQRQRFASGLELQHEIERELGVELEVELEAQRELRLDLVLEREVETL